MVDLVDFVPTDPLSSLPGRTSNSSSSSQYPAKIGVVVTGEEGTFMSSSSSLVGGGMGAEKDLTVRGVLAAVLGVNAMSFGNIGRHCDP